MKVLSTASVVAFSSIALVSAQGFPDCDLNKLIAVARGPSGATCQADTQFTPSPGTIATGEKLLKICQNSNCQKVLAELAAVSSTECLYSGIPLKSDIIDKYNVACAAALKGSTTTTSPKEPLVASGSSANETEMAEVTSKMPSTKKTTAPTSGTSATSSIGKAMGTGAILTAVLVLLL